MPAFVTTFKTTELAQVVTPHTTGPGKGMGVTITDGLNGVGNLVKSVLPIAAATAVATTALNAKGQKQNSGAARQRTSTSKVQPSLGMAPNPSGSSEA